MKIYERFHRYSCGCQPVRPISSGKTYAMTATISSCCPSLSPRILCTVIELTMSPPSSWYSTLAGSRGLKELSSWSPRYDKARMRDSGSRSRGSRASTSADCVVADCDAAEGKSVVPSLMKAHRPLSFPPTHIHPKPAPRHCGSSETVATRSRLRVTVLRAYI